MSIIHNGLGLPVRRSQLPEKTRDILVVEDNSDDVFLLRQAFKKAEASDRLYVVGDGLQALAYLKGDAPYANRLEHPFPDFILLDLNMPRMNGFELLKALRQNPPWARLVVHVFSASSRASDVEIAYQLQANSFLVKPTSLHELVGLAQALHRWHCFISFPCKPDKTAAARMESESAAVKA